MNNDMKITLVLEIGVLAKSSYEAYGNNRDWKTHDGKPMPRWEDLSDVIRDAWRVAAESCISNMIAQLGLNATIDSLAQPTLEYLQDNLYRSLK